MDTIPTNKAQKGLGLGSGLGLKSNILASVGIASIGIVTWNPYPLDAVAVAEVDLTSGSAEKQANCSRLGHVLYGPPTGTHQ